MPITSGLRGPLSSRGRALRADPMIRQAPVYSQAYTELRDGSPNTSSVSPVRHPAIVVCGTLDADAH